jgi:hypothetical protein
MTLEKPAYNEEWRTFDFSPQLAAGETLTLAGVTIADSSGTDASAAMISSVTVYADTMIKYRLKAGTAGTSYLRTFRVTTSSGQILEDRAPVKIV